MASERIPRHMEYIRNLVEAMLDILEIILNLPAARNHDLVALLTIGCLVALSLPNGLNTRITEPVTVRMSTSSHRVTPCRSRTDSPACSRHKRIRSSLFLIQSRTARTVPGPHSDGPSSRDEKAPVPSGRDGSSFPCSMFPLLMWKADTNTIVLRQPEILSRPMRV